MKKILLILFLLNMLSPLSAQDFSKKDSSLFSVSYGISQASFGIKPVLGQYLTLGIEKPVYRVMVISGSITGTYMEQKRDYGDGFYFYESCNSVFVGCDYAINLRIKKVNIRPFIGGSFGYFDRRYVTQLGIGRRATGITQFDYFMVTDYAFVPVYNLGFSFIIKIYDKCILSYNFKFIKLEDTGDAIIFHGLALKW